MTSKKLILVIGATGAQGIPVVSALLAAHNGNPSPYSVRALTRDSKSKQAHALASLGAELFEGRFDVLGKYSVRRLREAPALRHSRRYQIQI
ncbi:hypothetical protein EV359DRAFT_88369 [Lentinula novae-zelandiae]|nr:hypothetical protein EV359DRAFT_88369 [Lentinula novae-zelandiae]